MHFRASLLHGQAGESAVAAWLKRRGHSILPVYETDINSGKGPRLFIPGESLIAPDLFVFKGASCLWIECKRKSAFSWYRNGKKWQTGIDVRHFHDYCRVADETPWPVWLLFLHENGRAKDSPEGCPAGLFGQDLRVLRENIDHKHDIEAMVYWNHEDLKLIASLDEVFASDAEIP